MLTTFVASCVDSSLEPMAARAKKILQEEGSHRAHGEAWARRLLRGADRDAFVARLLETWEHAGRWIGPDDDAEYRGRASRPARSSRRAAAQRELMRAWLADMLAAEGVRAHAARAHAGTAGTPSAAGGRRELPVLRLGARSNASRQWGGQIITAQWRCGACNSYFEAVRDDYSDSPISAPMTSVMPSGTPSSHGQPANRPDAA